MLTDQALLRYSRQIMLPGLDVAGQQALAAARVLVVGLGGLGSACAQYLAGAGVGQLVLADGDRVELSNLPRQVLHSEARVGRNKAESAAQTLAAMNAEVSLSVLPRRLEPQELPELCRQVDIVVDATDNFATRCALNQACIESGQPLVSAAAIRLEGQLAVFDTARGGPCYRCLYPEPVDDSALRCSENGVLGPVVGVLGALQAMETLKWLSGLAPPLDRGLLLVDLGQLEFTRLSLPRRANCPACATGPFGGGSARADKEC
ncbi:HesA/MoeB/ThiF family protein [Haliea atlantica]